MICGGKGWRGGGVGYLHDDICECAADDDYDAGVLEYIIIIIIIPTACIPTVSAIRPVCRHVIIRSIGICQITTTIIIISTIIIFPAIQ